MKEDVKLSESQELSAVEKYILDWKQCEVREALRVCGINLSDECRVTLGNDKDAVFTYRELIDTQSSVEHVTGFKIQLEHVLRRQNDKVFNENTMKISGEWYFVVQKNGRTEILSSTISDEKNDGIKFLANTPEDLKKFMQGMRPRLRTAVPGMMQRIASRLSKKQAIDEKDFFNFLKTLREDFKKTEPRFNAKRCNIQGWDDENGKFEYIENIVKKEVVAEKLAKQRAETRAKIEKDLDLDLDLDPDCEQLSEHDDPISGNPQIIETLSGKEFETILLAPTGKGDAVAVIAESIKKINAVLALVFSNDDTLPEPPFKKCDKIALETRVVAAQKIAG